MTLGPWVGSVEVNLVTLCAAQHKVRPRHLHVDRVRQIGLIKYFFEVNELQINQTTTKAASKLTLSLLTSVCNTETRNLLLLCKNYRESL